MGYIRHEALIVIDNGYGDGIEVAHTEAARIYNEPTTEPEKFGGLVSPIVSGVMNGYRSFFIAPDGSKEGWEHSDIADTLRQQFIQWLHANGAANGHLMWVSVAGFGGDDNAPYITGSNRQHEDDE